MLSGPLGGSLFSRRLLTYIQAWTSTSTSLVMRRLRSLSLKIILKNRVLLLKPTPPLHRLFLLLTPKFLHSSRLPDVDFYTFLFMYICFLLGLGPNTYVAFLLINIHFFFSFVSLLTHFALFFINCINFLVVWPNLIV